MRNLSSLRRGWEFNFPINLVKLKMFDLPSAKSVILPFGLWRRWFLTVYGILSYIGCNHPFGMS